MSTSISRPAHACGRIVECVLAALVACAIACVSTPGRLRFANEAPHWRVADRIAAAPPRTRRVERFDADIWFYRPVRYVLAVPDPRVAANVNSLGEVPDCTWFTNRIGVREVTVEEVRRGPNRDEGPVPPLQIRKLAEDRQGLVVVDARGLTFLLELDLPGLPELTTGADVVVQRLLWAVGYHVPEDSITFIARDDLVMDGESVRESKGQDLPLRPEDLDRWLAGRERSTDGRVRALASKFVPGVPVGPYADDGRRRDDPNDRVAHEHRRDLRGQLVFFAWLGHTDLNPSNRLDMWVEDPRHPGKGHLEHWLIDFDRALGAMALTNDVPWDGYSYTFDYGLVVASTLGLGLWQRPWEGVEAPPLRGLGRFESASFELDRFRPRHYYAPFLYRDERDDFWATRILMRLRPEHIRAAVEAARYSDPRTVEYLVATLVDRQHAIARSVFGRVNPIDGFGVAAGAGITTLCGLDLLVYYGLTDAADDTRYTARAFDYAGLPFRWRPNAVPAEDGTFCLDRLPRGRTHEGYTIVEIRTHRGARVLPPVLVHLAVDPDTRALRVIGIDRRLRARR